MYILPKDELYVRDVYMVVTDKRVLPGSEILPKRQRWLNKDRKYAIKR